ncbi:MAG: hypothetical protein AAFN78_14430 [Pseudomonadota bacterium]
MERFFRLLAGFVVAVILAEVLAALASTQFVLAELGQLGIDVSIGDRLAMSLHDIAGMLPLYGGIIAATYLIALPVAAWLARRAPQRRSALFFAAGFVGLLTAITLMRFAFDIMPIAGARSFAGLVTQGLAGGAAALVFLLPVFQSDGRA